MTKLRRYYPEEDLRAIRDSMEPDVMREFKGAVEHSPEEIRELQEMIAGRPQLARMAEVTVQYATERGGLILDCLRLLYGPWFGEPWIMTPAACAEEVGVTLETLEDLLAEIDEAIHQRLGGGEDEQSAGPSCGLRPR